MAKRRVGLGFTGLGDALNYLRLRYDSGKRRATAAKISAVHARYRYRASSELGRSAARSRFSTADMYLSGSASPRAS